jgi:hypothetical protein
MAKSRRKARRDKQDKESMKKFLLWSIGITMLMVALIYFAYQ